MSGPSKSLEFNIEKKDDAIEDKVPSSQQLEKEPK